MGEEVLNEMRSTYLDLILANEESWNNQITPILEKFKNYLHIEVNDKSWSEGRNTVLMAFNDAIEEEEQRSLNHEDNRCKNFK